MAEWKTVAEVDELPDGTRMTSEYGDVIIALFNVSGEIFAISNQCPHAAGPLLEGFVEEGRIICPWHAWSFPLSPEDPPNDGLGRYRVRIVDSSIQVQEVPQNKSF